ncbi:MAG: diadenylate cyclase [Deltaproteobacteria bacterium]|jgi:hypothetical protein|nr:diadenylate cyclase [Deltaproteobacteria bacterium]
MDERSLQTALEQFLRGYFSVFEPAPELEVSVFRTKAGLVDGLASTVWKLEDFSGPDFSGALRMALLESGSPGSDGLAPNYQEYGHFYPDFFQDFLIQHCRSLPEGAGRRFYALPRSQEGESLLLPLFSLKESWLSEAGEFFQPAMGVLRSFLEREAGHENALLDAYQAQRLHSRAAAVYLARVTGHPDAFACLNAIASLKYEKQECSARIAFSKESDKGNDNGNSGNDKGEDNGSGELPGIPAIPLKAAFEPSLSLTHYRKTRKLLAALDDRLCLIASGARLLGIARAEDCAGPDVYLASLLKHLTWEISRQGRVLLRSEEGRLVAGRKRMQDKEIVKHARRILNLDQAEAGRVLALIKGAAGAGHGGMLVFSEEAEQEAARLCKDAITVQPFTPEAEDLAAFSVMDGAILMDLDCRCHALGVILDGPACGNSDSSRGARYNSALRYYEKNAGKKLLLAVLSDDGMFNLIPNPLNKAGA